MRNYDLLKKMHPPPEKIAFLTLKLPRSDYQFSPLAATHLTHRTKTSATNAQKRQLHLAVN